MTQKYKNKILIICPSMLPKMNFWGETQRMYYLADYLAVNNWEVYTVSPEFEGKQSDDLKRQRYKSYFIKYRKKTEVKKAMQTCRKKSDAILRKLRKALSKILTPVIKWIYNEPDCYEGLYKQIWLWKYKNDICKIIEENEIDTVIISVPAFVFLQMGKVIHKKYADIRIIFDYRDPWYLWNLKKNLAYWRERRYLYYADYIIGFSNPFTADMIKYLKADPQKISTVWNGYSEEDWRLFEKREAYQGKGAEKKLRLVFTGNILVADRKSNYRNPCRLIEAVKQFQNVELYLVGVMDLSEDIIDGNIYYIRNVEQQEAFMYMKMGDVLVSIHDSKDTSGKYIVSGKFFDYMRSGKVIWHIGARDSLMTQMIQEDQLGVWCENKREEIENILEELFQKWKNGTIEELRNCSIEKVSTFSRENQNRRYNEILCGNRN